MVNDPWTRAWNSRAVGTHKLVLLAIAQHYPEMPEITTIQRMTGLGLLTVQRALVDLRQSGEIERVRAS